MIVGLAVIAVYIRAWMEWSTCTGTGEGVGCWCGGNSSGGGLIGKHTRRNEEGYGTLYCAKTVVG